jgi:aryl-alcohol dehydrogenase-like predicted oxidoreductase
MTPAGTEKTRFLSNAGRVSAVGLGSMPLAIEGRPSEADAARVIHAALDAGMNWIDTADAYCRDSSEVGYGERLVARALREWGGARDDVRVATKGGKRRPSGDWVDDGRPEHLRRACEASLRSLGISSVFLYQLHAPDRNVSFADSVGALADLKREGKIQHIGLCNVDVNHIRQARAIVEIVSVQNRCNIFERHCFANGVVDLCERQGIAFIAHSPVGGHVGHERVASHPVLRAVAARGGSTPHQVALAWLLARSPSIVVIPGASRVESARASAAAADVILSPGDLADLRRAFPDASLLRKKVTVARGQLRHLARSFRVRATRFVSTW